MTTPDERTRNLLLAGAFLKELREGETVPEIFEASSARHWNHNRSHALPFSWACEPTVVGMGRVSHSRAQPEKDPGSRGHIRRSPDLAPKAHQAAVAERALGGFDARDWHPKERAARGDSAMVASGAESAGALGKPFNEARSDYAFWK